MKVGIYHELFGTELGGAEYTVAVLAEALQHAHDVELVNHSPRLAREQLARFCGVDLADVRVRAVPIEDVKNGALSASYDLFIAFVHGRPPVCRAGRGLLIVLFPFFVPPDGWVGWARPARRRWFSRTSQRTSDVEWRRAIESYERRAAISHFAAQWTKAWWHIDCEVVYPPVDTMCVVRAKRNAVLTVGRFSTEWHTKKQAELLSAFHGLDTAALHGWRYILAGGLSDTPNDRVFFDRLRGQTCTGRSIVVANVERRRLKRLYERSALLWLGTGLGADMRRRPDLAEHFGIVIVEAMAAGCVPLVIARGGPTEIVEHGLNGLLWHTLEDLQRCTVRLARDVALREAMATAARARARMFSRERFLTRMQSLIKRQPGLAVGATAVP